MNHIHGSLAGPFLVPPSLDHGVRAYYKGIQSAVRLGIPTGLVVVGEIGGGARWSW